MNSTIRWIQQFDEFNDSMNSTIRWIQRFDEFNDSMNSSTSWIQQFDLSKNGKWPLLTPTPSHYWKISLHFLNFFLFNSITMKLHQECSNTEIIPFDDRTIRSVSDNKPFIRSSISVHFIFCNSQDMQRSLPPVLIFDLLIISFRTTNEYGVTLSNTSIIL